MKIIASVILGLVMLTGYAFTQEADAGLVRGSCGQPSVAGRVVRGGVGVLRNGVARRQTRRANRQAVRANCGGVANCGNCGG